MKIKKGLFLVFVLILLSGCTTPKVKRVDNIDFLTRAKTVLSLNIKHYNEIGKGYKYYAPRGVSRTYANYNNDVLKKNKGKIYAGWLKAGEKVGFIPKFLTQDEVDPKYLTVLGKIRTLSAKELASEIIFHCPGLGKDGYYVEDLKERVRKEGMSSY